MELRQLRYFEAVVRHRHFTNAADELQVAQSALSHQVRRLEQELGTELLRRTTRSVAPTQAGELVAARARTVLAETSALKGELDELRGLTRGHVAVGAMLFGGELDIPAILARFTTSYPEVEIRLRDGIAGRFLEMLREGSLDVAFALEAEPAEGVQRLELSSEELVVAVSPDHPLAGTRPLSIEALEGTRLIAFQRGSSTRQLIDDALTAAHVEHQIAFEASDLALLRSLVAGGLGVAIFPRSFLERPGPEVCFRPLHPAPRMTVALWWVGGRRLSPAAQAFVDFVAAQRAA